MTHVKKSFRITKRFIIFDNLNYGLLVAKYQELFGKISFYETHIKLNKKNVISLNILCLPKLITIIYLYCCGNILKVRGSFRLEQ